MHFGLWKCILWQHIKYGMHCKNFFSLYWWHTDHFPAPVSGARNHDTLSQQMILAACQLCFCSRFYHKRFLIMHYTETRFFRTVLWDEKYFHHSTSPLVFGYKHTSSAKWQSKNTMQICAKQPKITEHGQQVGDRKIDRSIASNGKPWLVLRRTLNTDI